MNWNVDRFIIGRFHGAVPVAIYGVAALLNAQYLSFSTAISSVLKPRVNTMVASGQSNGSLSDLFVRVGRIQYLILGLVLSGYIFFGRRFIEFWAGEDYGEAYVIALLLLVAVTPDLIQNLGIEIQRAKNMQRFRTWVYLVVAAVNIAISIPLTQSYGAVGAAVATAIALLIGNGVVMNWYYHARVGIDIRGFWRQIGLLSRGLIPAVLCGGLVTFVVASTELPVLGLLAFGVIYILVYAVGMWFIAMNDYERRLFASPFRRFFDPSR